MIDNICKPLVLLGFLGIFNQTAAAQSEVLPSAPFPTQVVDNGDVDQIVELKKERFRKIQQQLDKLSKAWQQRQSRISGQDMPIPTESHPAEIPDRHDNSESTHTGQIPPTVTPSVPIPGEAPPTVAPAFPTVRPEVPSIAPNLPTLPSTTEVVEVKPSTDRHSQTNEPLGPIDRFALATSLYATRNFDQCLQVLESLEDSELKLYELEWSKFLKAGCLRHTGEVGESLRLYRQLVADDQTEWISQTSRWWLTHLNEQSENKQGLTELQAALEQWELEVNELIANPK